MLFTQVSHGRRIHGRCLKQIDQRFSRPQRHHVVTCLGLAFLLQDEAKALRIEGLHGSKPLSYQRNVVNAFIGEHSPFILRLESSPLKRILSSRTTFRTLTSLAERPSAISPAA